MVGPYTQRWWWGVLYGLLLQNLCKLSYHKPDGIAEIGDIVP